MFIGVARGSTVQGETVAKLELRLKADEEEVDMALGRLLDEVKAEKPVLSLELHALVGSFNVGEHITHAYTASRRRIQAFEALKLAVDKYKREASILLREFLEDGWII